VKLGSLRMLRNVVNARRRLTAPRSVPHCAPRAGTKTRTASPTAGSRPGAERRLVARIERQCVDQTRARCPHGEALGVSTSSARRFAASTAAAACSICSGRVPCVVRGCASAACRPAPLVARGQRGVDGRRRHELALAQLRHARVLRIRVELGGVGAREIRARGVDGLDSGAVRELFETSLGLRQVAARRVDACVLAPRVERQQHVAGRDAIALRNRPAQDGSRARGDCDPVPPSEPPAVRGRAPSSREQCRGEELRNRSTRMRASEAVVESASAWRSSAAVRHRRRRTRAARWARREREQRQTDQRDHEQPRGSTPAFKVLLLQRGEPCRKRARHPARDLAETRRAAQHLR
jgi:hypothetical protein